MVIRAVRQSAAACNKKSENAPFLPIPAPQIVIIAMPDSTHSRNVLRPSSSRNIFWRALPREVT